MHALLSVLVLGDALLVGDTYWKEEGKSLFELTKTNRALYKHLRARTDYLEMYGKWTCVCEFSTT